MDSYHLVDWECWLDLEADVMLVSLHVKNLAIIDEVEVDFRDHLNILTGETGAGKSIIIGSINMALGGKASADIIRSGADYGLVELVFDMKNSGIADKMSELDIPIEDGQVILSRKIMKNRSICKVNGETVTMATVRELAGELLDIHGQHEHQSLLCKHKHLEILDQFGKCDLGEFLEELSLQYKEYKQAKEEFDKKNVSQEERIRQLSFMEYEYQEIEQAQLKEGEDEELALLYKRYSNAQQIAEGLQSVHQITAVGMSSVSDELGRAVKQLYKIADYDQTLQDFLENLQNMEEQLTDFNYQLQDYMADMEFDESRFIEIENRLNLYHSLKAKYGDSVPDIIQYQKELEEKIEQYKEYDLYLEKLKNRLDKKEQSYLKLAATISKIRKKNATVLAEQIKQALVDLNFLDVQFAVTVTDTKHYTDRGMDEVEFVISTNLGEKMRPLGKVASGGELSRIMLAIKSVLAKQDDTETLIFDEIDVGISGRTAQKVSEKMALIAKKHQVICITHLPQIAAMADEHFIIEKMVENDKTSTHIRALDQKGSIEELARILGGAEITDTVRESAQEMKKLANQKKVA